MTEPVAGPGEAAAGVPPSPTDRPALRHRGDAPAVYGSLLVTTLIVVQWRFDDSVERIAFSLLVSVGAFWLTHVWSEVVTQRVQGPIDRHVVLGIARGESPMLATALIPAAILALARVGMASVDQAIVLALMASIVQLFLWGLAAGHALGRGWLVALGIALVDVALGLAIVVLKVVVIH